MLTQVLPCVFFLLKYLMFLLFLDAGLILFVALAGHVKQSDASLSLRINLELLLTQIILKLIKKN